MNGRLLTRYEAANKLGCSVSHVDRLIADGKLAAVKVGRLVKITPDEYAAFLERSTKEITLPRTPRPKPTPLSERFVSELGATQTARTNAKTSPRFSDLLRSS